MSRTNEVSFPVLTEGKKPPFKKTVLAYLGQTFFFAKMVLTLSCIYVVIFAHMDEALLYSMYLRVNPLT